MCCPNGIYGNISNFIPVNIQTKISKLLPQGTEQLIYVNRTAGGHHLSKFKREVVVCDLQSDTDS